MRRWLVRIALAAIAIVVLAVAGLAIFVHTGWGRGVLAGEVEDALAAQFPGGVHVGALELGMFGEIVIRDLRIDRPDHQPELVVREVRIGLARWPLLGKTVRIDRLELDGVTATVPPPAPSAPARPPSPSAAVR